MRHISLVLACALAALGPGSARAQAPLNAFNVMRFTPAPGARNYLQIEGATVAGHLEGSAGIVLDYGHAPFVLYDASCPAGGGECMVTGTRAELMHYVLAFHLMGTVQLFDRIQIGLVVPLALTSGQSFAYTDPVSGGPVMLSGGDGFNLADPRLHVKGNILSESGFSLAASAFLTAPTGQAIASTSSAGPPPARFLGDRTPTFGGSVIGEYVGSGLHVSANVGGTWRDGDLVFSSYGGSQLTYGVGAGYDVTPMVMILGELVGASSFVGQTDEHNLEWRVGGRLRIEDFEVSLGGGTGLSSGGGTPLFRILGGFQWAPIRRDGDRDGVLDASDACPDQAEDVDNYNDEDGCPEPDNDEDGRADGDDPCPDEAEDIDHHEDEDGCPDADNDGDGIHDGYDSCPDEAEDMDEDRDTDGCPDNDADRDGIGDDTDQCANEAEDFDGFGDEDGCPETDFDQDGVPDDGDQCPDQAEDRDEFEDEDGCAEEGAPPAAHHPPAHPPAGAPAPRRRARAPVTAEE